MKFLQTEIKIDKNRMRYGIKYKTLTNSSVWLEHWSTKPTVIGSTPILSTIAYGATICSRKLQLKGSRFKTQVSKSQTHKVNKYSVLRLIWGTRFLGMSLDKLVFLLSFKTSKASCLGGNLIKRVSVIGNTAPC